MPWNPIGKPAEDKPQPVEPNHRTGRAVEALDRAADELATVMLAARDTPEMASLLQQLRQIIVAAKAQVFVAK